MSAAASERRSSASRIVRQSASSVRPRAVGGVLVVMAAGAVSVRGLACRCARPEDSRLSPAAVRATALIGTDELTLRCRGEEVVHPRQPFGGRRVDYRHYLAELARKPQAVRQVAPELVAALGEPFGPLWARLEREQGAQEGARTLARLLRAVDEHGERRVREVLEQTLASGTFDELAVQRLLASAQPAAAVTVPETLRGYEVESVSAAVYDRLLAAAAP